MNSTEITTNATTIEKWHLHRGTIRYFIVGPGSDAMHPCSEPVYEGRHPTMTPEESHIAHIAIALLTQRHAYDKNAAVAEIKTALADAAAGVRPDGSHKRMSVEPVAVTFEQLERIAGVVMKVTGCGQRELMDSHFKARGTRPLRHLFLAACMETFPGLVAADLERMLGFAKNNVWAGLHSHGNRLVREEGYRNLFQLILEGVNSIDLAA